MDGRSQRRKRRAVPRMVEVKEENEEVKQAVPRMVEVKEENEGPYHGW